ncbi:MAG: hypothetical protein ACLQFM_00020 [Terriglobales bacterium]
MPIHPRPPSFLRSRIVMNYVENAMPRLLGCPDGVAGFYGNLDVADDERLHAIGVSAQCTRQRCTRVTCPFHPAQPRE